MRQLLLLFLLFFIGQWVVKTMRRAVNSTHAPRGPVGEDAAGARGQTQRLAEPMVRCVTCGVHTPQSESILVAGQRFCCAEHAERQAARSGSRPTR